MTGLLVDFPSLLLTITAMLSLVELIFLFLVIVSLIASILIAILTSFYAMLSALSFSKMTLLFIAKLFFIKKFLVL
jgi:hypothetical protein